MLYAPGHSLKYFPTSDPSSTRYHGLDLLHISGSNGKGKLAKLYFNRPATVYLFVGVKGEGARAKLHGWKSEGYARLNNPDDTDVKYGIFQRGIILVPTYAYVFSKQVRSAVNVPTEPEIWRSLKLQTTLRTHMRVGGWNGKPSLPSGSFEGKTIRPNTKCPESLHRTWVAKNSDSNDPTVKKRLFATWHPVWDPCFWCSYGHDHGSSPKALMGYEPSFEYTAMKNSFEREAHPGFKGFVFPMGRFKVYFSIHAQTSKLRRISERYHTTVIAIVDEKGKLMAELCQKADFGFLSARGGRGVGFVPLRPIDKQIMASQNLNFGEKRLRSVNVINKYRLDRRFRYQRQKVNLMKGVYEAWITGVMCGLPKRGGEMTVDIKNPLTGIKSAYKTGTMIKLHKETQNVGLFRSIKMDVQMGIEHCKFKNGGVKGGVFYTDPRGEKLVKGPGPRALRQYIHPDFKARLHGKFEVTELGLGMYKDGARGFWSDHGYGIDVKNN